MAVKRAIITLFAAMVGVGGIDDCKASPPRPWGGGPAGRNVGEAVSQKPLRGRGMKRWDGSAWKCWGGTVGSGPWRVAAQRTGPPRLEVPPLGLPPPGLPPPGLPPLGTDFGLSSGTDGEGCPGPDEGPEVWRGRRHEAPGRTYPPSSSTARIAQHRCGRKGPEWPNFIEDRSSVVRRYHLAAEGAG